MDTDKTTPKSRVERRVENVVEALDRLTEDVEDGVRRAKNRMRRLTRIMVEEVAKDALSFDAVKATKPRWSGEILFFKGARKFRVEDDKGKVEFEKSRSDLQIYVDGDQGCGSFYIPADRVQELVKWLRSK